MKNRQIICVLLMFLVMLTSTAYGISVKLSAGNQDGFVSSTTSFAGTTIDKVNQDMKLNPVLGNMENYLTFTGSGSTSREVGTTSGPRAKTGFTVRGTSGYTSTSYEFASSFTSTYARSWMDLSSYKANYIGVFGWAQSSGGSTPCAYANGGVGVQSLSNTANLVGYTVNAQGWVSSARVDQDYSSASTSGTSGYIIPNVKARVSADHTHTDTDHSLCIFKLYSSSSTTANSPYTTLAGLNGGYKGYAYANQGTERETIWQDIYGKGASPTANSQAYSWDLNSQPVDIDYYTSGTYHLIQQDAWTTGTSVYARNIHYL